jgi:hypothetical protein
MDRYQVRWFSDNSKYFKKAIDLPYGKVYEYRKFKKKLSQAIKHNFLIRNQIIKGQYL